MSEHDEHDHEEEPVAPLELRRALLEERFGTVPRA